MQNQFVLQDALSLCLVRARTLSCQINSEDISYYSSLFGYLRTFLCSFSLIDLRNMVIWLSMCDSMNHAKQGYKNQDFTSSRKGVAKSGLVKSQSKSKDFTQGLL